MRLALGTAQFGLRYGVANQAGQIRPDAARAIVARAWSGGIDTLDTAITYGDSETRLGDIGVAGWRVVSKLPAVPDGCSDIAAWVAGSVEESRRRLRIEVLHGLLLHRPEQLRSPRGERIYSALTEVRAAGLVAKIGFSIYHPGDLDGLSDRYPPDIVQAPFSIVDRRFVDSGLASRLHAAGVELHVRSIFLQGLLLMDPTLRPRRFDRWQRTWNCWHEWLAITGLTPLQACVRYALTVPTIDRVVVGVDTLAQLEEILEAAAGAGDPVSVPDELRVEDTALVNPGNWNALA